jgi:hypothetical protein
MDDLAQFRKSITDLKNYFDEIEVTERNEVIINLAFDYAEDNPGDYLIVLPGIILPLFT